VYSGDPGFSPPFRALRVCSDYNAVRGEGLGPDRVKLGHAVCGVAGQIASRYIA
jgi:hypothetical protein